jgi:glycosyltransferase involved in cell wall biosynthesis
MTPRMSDAAQRLRVVAFATEGVFSSVLPSQVVVPLSVLGGVAPQADRALLVLTSFRHRRHPDFEARAASVRASLPKAQVRFAFRPPSPFPFEKAIWMRLLKGALERYGFHGPEPIILHCRGETATATAAHLKRRDPRIRVLLDLRGALDDEISGGGLLRWYRTRSMRQRRHDAFAGADAFNTVSHKLAAYADETGLLRPGIARSVVACCADPKRFYYDPAQRAEQRAALGFGKDFVLCYCGGMWHWQRPDAVADLFAAVHRTMPDARMFIVSRQSEVLREELRKRNVPDDRITARAANHDEVVKLLMAADVGLLLRENTVTNLVASPVKFAEYLRCGLPVVLTPYVGDFSESAAAAGVGATVPFPIDDVESVKVIRDLRSRLEDEGDALRQRCSAFAAQHCSWDTQIHELLRVYRELAAR